MTNFGLTYDCSRFCIDIKNATLQLRLQSTNCHHMTFRVKLHKSEKKREQCDVVYQYNTLEKTIE